MQFRASAFVPPPGKTAEDQAQCRICLQTDQCSVLIKACGCKHSAQRSAYVHQDCILRWIERDKRTREGGCKICKSEWKFHEAGKPRGESAEASGRKEDEPKQDRDMMLALGVLFQYLWSRVKAHTASEKEEILLLEAGLQRPGPWTSWVNRTLEKQRSLFALSPQSISMGNMRPGSRRGSTVGNAGGTPQPLIPSTGGTGLTRRIRRSSMLRDRGSQLVPGADGGEAGTPTSSGGGGQGASARRPSLMGGSNVWRPGGSAPEPRKNSTLSDVGSSGRSRSSTGSSTASFRMEDPRLDLRVPGGDTGAEVGTLLSPKAGPAAALMEAWERMANGSGTVPDLHLFTDTSANFHGPWTELLRISDRSKERRASIDASSLENNASLFQVLSTSWYALSRGQGGLSDLRTLVRKGKGALGPWSSAIEHMQDGSNSQGGRARRASIDVSSMIFSDSFPTEENLEAVASGDGGRDKATAGRGDLEAAAEGRGPWEGEGEAGSDKASRERRLSISMVETLIHEAMLEAAGPADEQQPQQQWDKNMKHEEEQEQEPEQVQEPEQEQEQEQEQAVATAGEEDRSSPGWARGGATPQDPEPPANATDPKTSLCWVCSIGGEIFDLHETCQCVGPNQFAHADCWKSWIQERKTPGLKTHCPDCGRPWKLMHLIEGDEPARPVFDDHTGAEIKEENDPSSPHNSERPPTEDIQNALTILFARVAQNNLTPRNKDLLRLVGSQFPGTWSKWIKQQVAHRRRNRLSVSGPAEEMTPVEPTEGAPGAPEASSAAEGAEGEEGHPVGSRLERKPSIVDYIPFLSRRKSFSGFKSKSEVDTESQSEKRSESNDFERHVGFPTSKGYDRRSLPSLSEDVDGTEVPDRRRSILTYTPEPRKEQGQASGAGGSPGAVSTSQIDLAEHIIEKNRRGSNFGIFSFRGAGAADGSEAPRRKGSILNVFSTFSRRFSVSVKKKGLFGRRTTMKMKTPTRLRIEADGEREAWEDQAPARGYDDYEAQMDVTCFCCYSAKPDLR